MTYLVYSQLPKPKNLGVCELCLDNRGDADIFLVDPPNIEAGHLARARVEVIAKNGIKLSGFESRRSGNIRYQEWWCAYQGDGINA